MLLCSRLPIKNLPCLCVVFFTRFFRRYFDNIFFNLRCMEVASVWPTGWTGMKPSAVGCPAFFNDDQYCPLRRMDCPNARPQVTRATAKYRHEMPVHSAQYVTLSTKMLWGFKSSVPYVLHQTGWILIMFWAIVIKLFNCMWPYLGVWDWCLTAYQLPEQDPIQYKSIGVLGICTSFSSNRSS